MLGNSFRRKVVLALLCSILVAPWASAADLTARDIFSQAFGLLQRVWSLGEAPMPPDPPRPMGALIPLSEGEAPVIPDPPRPGEGDGGGTQGGPGRP